MMKRKMKKKVSERIKQLDRPRFNGGSLAEMQKMIQDILIKIDELELRIEQLEDKK
ncbi:MAG: hypothetical protein ACOC5T_09775 [Elusimicrobiota bacterium]